MKILKLGILLFLFGASTNLAYSQDSVQTIKHLTESIDQVTVDLGVNQDSKKTIDDVLGYYNAMSAVDIAQKVGKNQISVKYYKQKLNGPGIFIGLAKEASFREAKLIEIKD